MTITLVNVLKLPLHVLAVEEARDAGLQALSLTDHDTVEGIDEAIEAIVEAGGASLLLRWKGDSAASRAV